MKYYIWKKSNCEGVILFEFKEKKMEKKLKVTIKVKQKWAHVAWENFKLK